MSFFQNFTKTVQDGLSEGLKEAQKLSTDFTPYAQRTARQLQEKFGQTDDISQLPQEYVELEKKVDTLKVVYSNLLAVTSTYENESYDSPSHLKESVIDISKNISTKVEKLASAKSTEEAQSILIASNPKSQPKTLNYALATATNLSALKIQQSSTDDSFDSLAQGLTQLGLTESKVAEARLQQDKLIRSKVNDQFRKQLKFNLVKADKARKLVENKRLSYDAARASLKTARPEKEASLRVTLETLEDEFAAATEDAVATLRSVVESASVLSELVEFVTAQLAYHKAASELLEDLLPNLENLRDESGSKVLSDVEDSEI